MRSGGPAIPCKVRPARGIPTVELVRPHISARMTPHLSPASADWTLALRSGDPAALAQAYEEHAPAVRRIAWRILGNRPDTDDVVQDVFLGLPEAMRHYTEQGSFAAWLRTLTARTALLRLRRASRRREEPLVDEAPGHPGIREPADAIAARLTLAAALARLPDDLRLVFVLKEMEGYSHAEIATLLGIRVGTSEVRLHRAFKRLRAILEHGT